MRNVGDALPGRAQKISQPNQPVRRTLASFPWDRQAFPLRAVAPATMKGAQPKVATRHLPPDQVDVVAVLRALRRDITFDEVQARSSPSLAPHTASSAPVPDANLPQVPRDPDYEPFNPVATATISTSVPKGRVLQTNLPQRALLLALLVVAGVFLLVLLIDRSQQSGGAGTQEARQAMKGLPGEDAPVDPSTYESSPTTITTNRGTLAVPGTGYVDGRILTEPRTTLNVVWLWDEPFDGQQRGCKLPHGTAVLLLETRASPDGRQAVRIQHQECTGWLDADAVSPTFQPPEGPIENNDIWQPGK